MQTLPQDVAVLVCVHLLLQQDTAYINRCTHERDRLVYNNFKKLNHLNVNISQLIIEHFSSPLKIAQFLDQSMDAPLISLKH